MINSVAGQRGAERRADADRAADDPEPEIEPTRAARDVGHDEWKRHTENQMHGAATFFDARFNEKDRYPVSAKSGAGNMRNMPDKTTAKLAALHFYRLTWWTTTTHNSTFISAARKKTIWWNI